MHEVLNELNTRPGIRGSLVATPDGMVVTSRLQGAFDPETAAALTSTLLAGAHEVAKQCRGSELSRFVLVSTRGKVIMVDLGNAYLVVVTDRHIDLNQGLIEIESAAQALRKMGRLPV
jgi:predicted regulator of Ras-like GTPase activity (Roadblock/LC7/MglB family)